MATATAPQPTAAERHQQDQEALIALVPAVMAQAWPLLDVHNIKGTLPQFLAAVRAIVARYGLASASAALTYYKTERLAAGVTAPLAATLAPTPPEALVEAAVQQSISDLYGPVSPQTTAAVQQKVDEAVSQLILDQGRQTIIDAALSDKRAKGWVRVTEPGACAFCTMLALRGGAGMLYRTEESADFQAHDNCRCHVEAVFTAYEPSHRMRQMQALWRDSTEGHSGKAALKAFRQALEGRKVTPAAKPKRTTTSPERAAKMLPQLQAAADRARKSGNSHLLQATEQRIAELRALV